MRIGTRSKIMLLIRSKLFHLGPSVILFDLTKYVFEGSAEKSEAAQTRKSKEKRSDCPLITLAIVLDGSRFLWRSHLYSANVK